MFMNLSERASFQEIVFLKVDFILDLMILETILLKMVNLYLHIYIYT